MTKAKRVALYLRVSKDESTTENQRLQLEDVAKRHDWKIVAIYEDDAISGAKGRDKRPGFDRLLKGVARREFDLVAAWAIDRLGRSLHHLLDFMMELKAKDVDLYLDKQRYRHHSPLRSRAMFQMAGCFAEFEREMTIERVHAGLDRARKQNKRLGRPPVMTPKMEHEARRLLADHGILKVAKMLGVGTGTIQKIKNEMRAA